MNTSILLDLILGFGLSFAITLLVIPILKKLAGPLGLLDKPNARKVHLQPIPVVGGLAIATSLFLSTTLNPLISDGFQQLSTLTSSSFILLLLGSVDDKLDLKASLRLFIQIACALIIARAGIRLTSLYGIFGIYELSNFASYTLTTFLITGVVNAFNLVDGIDGLAGLLAIVGITAFLFLSLSLEAHHISAVLTMALASVLAFLRYNLSEKKKIFLGDGGSLFLGFTLVAVGIMLIENSSSTQSSISVQPVVSIVFGIFIIPVLDSMRVYMTRMNRGFSPFTADKSHIHHLLLAFRFTHKQSSIILGVLAILLILVVVLCYNIWGITTAILSVSLFFLIVSGILSSMKNLNDWKMKIQEFENAA